MDPYCKIQTVWSRDPATKHRTLIEGEWATAEFAALSDLVWEWTEKIDGTNIRVGWDGDHVRYGGRTEKASIPTFLYDHLAEVYTPEVFRFNSLPPMTIYGEGYGARIQKGGGNYIQDGVGFIAFDVFCGDVWLGRANVQDVAAKIGAPVVPCLGAGTLRGAIGAVRSGLPSVAAEARCCAEGIVMRPPCGLLDRMGRRVIAKIKAKDFAPNKEKSDG